MFPPYGDAQPNNIQHSFSVYETTLVLGTIYSSELGNVAPLDHYIETDAVKKRWFIFLAVTDQSSIKEGEFRTNRTIQKKKVSLV